jgi:glycyl-tRNA synthetase beta chain
LADLLIEFFCEEIPARMQARAEADLARLVSAALQDAGLAWDRLEAFSGPRRLGLAIEGLPLKTQAVRDERKGPRTDAREKAIEGFLRGAGLASIDNCEVREDKKGAFYIAVIETPGRDTAQVLKSALPEIARNFPWPKSMKFGEGAKAQRWVRPLHRLICLLDGAVVPVEVFGLTASNVTEGHRIHGSGPFTVTGFADYAAQLKANGVILTRAERRQSILDDARAVCAKAGLELIEDEGLLDEVTGLAEHPVAVMGDMDTGFLDLPPEVITLTMRTHQKYFAVRDPKTGALAPKFVTIANQTAPDGGKAIAAGNARVLSARLSDARHFWDLDRAKGLEAMAGELSKVTFHDKLGTVADKTARVAALARELAPSVGADPDLAEIAARLAKADLVSQMVYEFPELQGVMGRYLYRSKFGLLVPNPGPNAFQEANPLVAREEARAAIQVAAAIRDHYKPQGPSDAVPSDPVSAAVALADKLDTLVGFWAIDEKPTGSKDPFALRRAALGVIRVLLEGNTSLSASKILRNAFYELAWSFALQGNLCFVDSSGTFRGIMHDQGETGEGVYDKTSLIKLMSERPVYFHSEFFELAEGRGTPFGTPEEVLPSLLAFFADRLKVHLKDEGIRHDVIDAVFALGDDDLVRVTNKSRALQAFLDTEDGAALLAGYRRAANILSAEEKKGFDLGAALNEVQGAVTASAPEEHALIAAIESAEAESAAALKQEDFSAAMSALARLRGPVDAFFEAVVVNDKDDIVRRNRLVLLSRIRAAADAVADFSRLEG